MEGRLLLVFEALTKFGVRTFQDLGFGRGQMSHQRTLVPHERTGVHQHMTACLRCETAGYKQGRWAT
jgi:hypothetical protein